MLATNHTKTLMHRFNGALTGNHNQTVVLTPGISPQHNQTVVRPTPTVKPQHNQTVVRTPGVVPQHNQTLVRR